MLDCTSKFSNINIFLTPITNTSRVKLFSPVNFLAIFTGHRTLSHISFSNLACDIENFF